MGLEDEVQLRDEVQQMIDEFHWQQEEEFHNRRKQKLQQMQNVKVDHDFVSVGGEERVSYIEKSDENLKDFTNYFRIQNQPPMSVETMKLPQMDQQQVIRRKIDTAKTPPKNKLLRIIEAAIAENEYLIVDKDLYFRKDNYFTKIDNDDFWEHLFNTLPEEYYDVLASVSDTTLLRLLKSKGDIQKMSMGNAISENEDFIAMKNGIFDISEGLLSLDSSAVCLVQLQAEYIDPSNIEKRQTPIWDKFIETISIGDQEIKGRLLDALACMLAVNVNLKKIFVFGTAPNSGKTTISDFVRAIFEEKDTACVTLDEFSDKFAFSAIAGKVLNLAMESPAGDIDQKAVQRLKLLTGERTVNVNRKYKAMRTERIVCKQVFGTNQPLILEKYDQAFFNRLEIIPFLCSVEVQNQDLQLLEKLKVEKNAIVSKLLDRLPHLKSRNWMLTKSKVADDMKYQWQKKADNMVIDFLEECCEITNKKKDFEEVPLLYSRYCAYAINNGAKICAKNVFTNKVRRQIIPALRQPNNVKKINDSQCARVIYGIKLKCGEEETDVY